MAFCRFSFKRRNTFSTSTTASSTSSPSAIAKPPSVMVLMVNPRYLKIRMVVNNDSGMATNEITVVRLFIKNSASTTTTIKAPSRSAKVTLSMELSIKSAWRNKNFGDVRPGGNCRPRSAIASSTSAVSAKVSAVGCFCTDKITAGCPWYPASPRFTAAAMPMFATCCNCTGGLPSTDTNNDFRSARSLLRPNWRIKYSCPATCKKPPLVLAPKLSSAAKTSA